MKPRFQRCFSFAIVGTLALASLAFGAPPPDSVDVQNSGKPNAPTEPSDLFRFAPMWDPCTLLSDDPKLAQALPNADYAMLWNPPWQEAAKLTDEQKKALLVIGAQALRDTNSLKRMSSKGLRAQIESVLTPEQSQSFKDDRFAAHAVELLYDAAVRQKIDFSPAQEEGFRAVAKQRLSRVQRERMKVSDKLWDLMSPVQRGALPEVVRRQGPTSAVLSISYELGFSYDDFMPSYPMLAMAPARERLALSPDQQKQLQVVLAEAGARLKNELQEISQPGAELKEERRVKAILTPEQLTTLEGIDFRRKVLLAMGYPEKQASIDMTDEQKGAFERFMKEAGKEIFRIDLEMVQKAARILTPSQREQLSTMIEWKPGS